MAVLAALLAGWPDAMSEGAKRTEAAGAERAAACRRRLHRRQPRSGRLTRTGHSLAAGTSRRRLPGHRLHRLQLRHHPLFDVRCAAAGSTPPAWGPSATRCPPPSAAWRTERAVVAVAGDGGFLFTAQELMGGGSEPRSSRWSGTTRASARSPASWSRPVRHPSTAGCPRRDTPTWRAFGAQCAGPRHRQTSNARRRRDRRRQPGPGGGPRMTSRSSACLPGDGRWDRRRDPPGGRPGPVTGICGCPGRAPPPRRGGLRGPDPPSCGVWSRLTPRTAQVSAGARVSLEAHGEEIARLRRSRPGHLSLRRAVDVAGSAAAALVRRRRPVARRRRRRRATRRAHQHAPPRAVGVVVGAPSRPPLLMAI